MKIDVVDGGNNIVLTIHPKLTRCSQVIRGIHTSAKMMPVVPISWLNEMANGGEIANGVDMMETVKVLPSLAGIQHRRKSISQRSVDTNGKVR